MPGAAPLAGLFSPAVAAVLCLTAMLALVYMLWRALSPRSFTPLPPPKASAAEPSPEVERRREPRRLGPPTPVRIRIEPGSSFRAWVIDRSDDGLGLQLPCPVAAGALVLLRPSRAPWGLGWVDAEVRHCHQLDGRHWHIGVRFCGPKPRDSRRLFG